jgi:hypothetical protein
MLGAQNVKPDLASLKNARASVDMACATASHKLVFSEAAKEMGAGNDVAKCEGENLTEGEYPSPCKASPHHW